MRHAGKAVRIPAGQASFIPPFVIAAFLIALAGGPHVHQAAADDAAADRADIKQIIIDQIEAFRHDDAAAAFHDAAPSIQQRFGDPAHFLEMVRRGYAPVYHPQSYRFGALATDNGETVQRVELVGPDGRAAVALYSMEREPDGSWRISGCTLLAGEDAAA